jgi:Tol biopolymer transport system component
MKRLCITLFLFSTLFFSKQVFADENPFVRFPALNKDGSKIAFNYQGDIWVKALNKDANANRITIHEGYELAPHWSPDGNQIAFSSNRYGNNDIYVIQADGSKPKRLTYHSTNDLIGGWASDNDLIFSTRRAYAQVEWDNEIYQVSLKGETPHRKMDAVGLMATVSPNERYVAFVRGACRTAREDYTGPANKDIWVYDTKEDKYHQITNYKGNDFLPDWVGNNTLYFISSRNSRYNVFKIQLDENMKPSANPEAITEFKDEGIRHFDVSADGSKLAFEKGISIHTKDLKNEGKIRKLTVTLPEDYRFPPVKHKTYRKGIREYDVSPNGKYTGMVIRGELFLINNEKDKSKTVRLTNHPFRDQDVEFVNDSTIVFVSDREGQKDLYLLTSADPDETDLYETLRYQVDRITDNKENETNPVIAPNGKKIAYQKGRGTLIVGEINTDKKKITNKTTLLDGWAQPSGLTWSPDNKWLAYSLPDLYFNSEIYIHAADNSKEPVNVSMHPKGDYSPYWSPDGTKLGFISERNNGDRDLWFAWLKKEDWQKTRDDWEDMEDDEENGKEKDSEEIEIDLEKIHERLEQVTQLPGNEAELNISKDGKTFYFVNNRSGRQRFDAEQDLHSIQWDGKKMKRLTQGGQNPRGMMLDHENSTLYMVKSGGVFAKFNTKKKKLKPVSIKAEMDINYKEELKQIFREGWSVIENGFYDPEHHGKDWEALKKKYKPYAMKASTKRDFRDIFNEMLGQLNASHMGIYGRDLAETEQERTGLLGLEVAPHPKGAVIKHIVPNTPADKKFSKLKKGEIITLVDGKELNINSNLYAQLINKNDEEVYLEVMDQEGNKRSVSIRPTNSIRQEKYREWVEERKKLTEKYSNGKLGYIHIQGMNWPSFERFQRELTASGYGKKGIVIDVRFNGGGWTTDYLMAVLDVTQHAYTVPRGATDNLDENHPKFKEYYPYSERLPLAAWTKPTIAMCNQNSYSNAEIFSHAYKSLDLGTLVGQPTFGAVISTGGQGLIDNSYIRLPFRGWYVKESEMNMEHGPAVPDIKVENKPGMKADNEDKQLKRAVEELLNQLEE